MNNDKSFWIFAIALISGVATLLAVMVATGIAAIPTPQTFVVELALALGVRASYKSLGGFDRSDWSVLGEGHAEPAAHPAHPNLTGATS